MEIICDIHRTGSRHRSNDTASLKNFVEMEIKDQYKKTVLSGIRSTGHLHLGNYFGALKNFVDIQDKYNCFFFIADLHSLTTHPHPADFHAGVRIILSEYLASGLDPEKAAIFVQSDIPEVSELYVLLNMLSYKGELERTVSFKDKVRLAKAKARNKSIEEISYDDNDDEGININAGLLTYPVLMASDILIHRANYVPVGKDQEQHLEYARVLARRFNNLYGTEVFPEPESLYFGSNPLKVPGLDGSGKMGKSEGNGIYLYDDEKTIHKKVMKALTDSGPTEPNSPMPEYISNLFTLMSLVSEPSAVEYFREKYNDCSIRYGEMKKQLAADICKLTLPIKEKIDVIYNDSDYLHKVTSMGREKARESASATLALVRKAVGFKAF